MKKIGVIGSQIIHSYGYGMHINEFDLDFVLNESKAIPKWQLKLMENNPDTKPVGGARITHISGGLENVPEDMAGTFTLTVTKTVDETIEACDLIMVMDEQLPSRTALIRKALERGKSVFADKILSDDINETRALIEFAGEKGVMLSAWSQMGYCHELDPVKRLGQGGFALVSFYMPLDSIKMYGIHGISPIQLCFPGKVQSVEQISKDKNQHTVFIENEKGTKIILSMGLNCPGGGSLVRIDYSVAGEAVVVEGKDKNIAFRRAAEQVVNMAEGIKPDLSSSELIDANMILEKICE